MAQTLLPQIKWENQKIKKSQKIMYRQLRDFSIQTGKQVLANQSDIMVIDKKQLELVQFV